MEANQRVSKNPRELVEQTFISLGFTDENPSDLDMVTELLQIWRDQDEQKDSSDKEIVYSPEQYALLNDPDVQEVLKRCRDYYAPKKHLTKQDLQSILEDIARRNTYTQRLRLQKWSTSNIGTNFPG